jgi:GTPase SAR1 family protein
MKMKIPPPFEIKVALIGYVSVGKTTFLNALLKDKYSEVSMKRTTAGVNLFRISTKQQGKYQDGDNEAGWSAEEFSSAQSTLQEITDDNQALRDTDILQEKTFEIELEEPLFEMRNDTNLVLIDVPGKFLFSLAIVSHVSSFGFRHHGHFILLSRLMHSHHILL